MGRTLFEGLGVLCMLSTAHGLRVSSEQDPGTATFFLYEPKIFEPNFQRMKNCKRKGSDFFFLEAIESSPRRTMDPSNASFFVLPCLAETVHRCKEQLSTERPPVSPGRWSQSHLDKPDCFTKIRKNDTYKAVNGWRHLWVNAYWDMNFAPKLTNWNQTGWNLTNMTIGRLERVGAPERAICDRENYQWQHEHCTIVVPMVSDLLYTKELATPRKLWDTFENWQQRRQDVAYFFDKREYVLDCVGAPDATSLRRQSLWLSDSLSRSNMSSTIQMGRVDSKTYSDHLRNSKFCLVMRGDTPSSHAFYDALATGCIPIVVSDRFADVALPSIRAGLKLSDFAVVVKESDIWDTDKVAERLKRLSNNDKELKRLFYNLQAVEPDLKWQMVDSNVGNNVLDEAARCVA